MKQQRAILYFAGALISTSLSALAGPPPTEAPTMKFRVLPTEIKTASTEHAVIPYRINDLVHVVVKDPVRCGQKPTNPSFELKGNQLTLRYELTPAPAGAATCILMSEFDIQNVPHEDVTIAFSGGGEPLSVAALQKCSFYDPKTSDVFECMTPAGKSDKKK